MQAEDYCLVERLRIDRSRQNALSYSLPLCLTLCLCVSLCVSLSHCITASLSVSVSLSHRQQVQTNAALAQQAAGERLERSRGARTQAGASWAQQAERPPPGY